MRALLLKLGELKGSTNQFSTSKYGHFKFIVRLRRLLKCGNSELKKLRPSSPILGHLEKYNLISNGDSHCYRKAQSLQQRSSCQSSSNRLKIFVIYLITSIKTVNKTKQSNAHNPLRLSRRAWIFGRLAILVSRCLRPS